MYILQVFPEFASILRVFIKEDALQAGKRSLLKPSKCIHQPGQVIRPLIRKLPRNQAPSPVFPECSRRIHARPVVKFQHILHLKNSNARNRTVCRTEDTVYDFTLVCRTKLIGNILKLPPLAFFRLEIARQCLVVVRSAIDNGVRIITVRQMLIEAVAAECKLNDLHARIARLC